MTELGNRLKEARLEKGMSLEDLQAATKIQKRYLAGIEEGDYSSIPGNFYVRAFIKQYSEAVGIDPDEIFETFKSEIPSTYNQDLTDQLSRVKSRENLSDGSSRIFDVLPKVLIALFILGAAVLIYYLLQKNAGDSVNEKVLKEKAPVNYVESDKVKKEKEAEEKKKEEKEKEKTDEAEVPAAPTQELAVIEGSGGKSTYELKNADKFELKLVSKGETWVNIKNAKGYSFFQGMLKAGATDSKIVDLSKETEVIIVVGRTVDTEIYVNEQKLEYKVPPTEAVRQDITIRYIQKNE